MMWVMWAIIDKICWLIDWSWELNRNIACLWFSCRNHDCWIYFIRKISVCSWVDVMFRTIWLHQNLLRIISNESWVSWSNWRNHDGGVNLMQQFSVDSWFVVMVGTIWQPESLLRVNFNGPRVRWSSCSNHDCRLNFMEEISVGSWSGVRIGTIWLPENLLRVIFNGPWKEKMTLRVLGCFHALRCSV